MKSRRFGLFDVRGIYGCFKRNRSVKGFWAAIKKGLGGRRVADAVGGAFNEGQRVAPVPCRISTAILLFSCALKGGKSQIRHQSFNQNTKQKPQSIRIVWPPIPVPILSIPVPISSINLLRRLGWRRVALTLHLHGRCLKGQAVEGVLALLRASRQPTPKKHQNRNHKYKNA